MIKIKPAILILILIQIISNVFLPIMPVTGVTGTYQATIEQGFEAAEELLSLDNFIHEVANGNKNQVVGIYVPEKFAQAVEAQPASNPAFVSQKPEVLTQFSTATKYGSLGFIAHNYLAGNDFFDLANGDIVIVIYGDGQVQNYRIYDIRHFQALSPNSPYSKFKEFDADQGNVLTAEQLFYGTYGIKNHLVFQTCIEENGESSWGRLFVLAFPMTDFITRSQIGGLKLSLNN